MEYYTKLNMEVEKSKIHTEWKIKRLQLDQSRIQLLSTEERNLKREKLELEHQQNESVMAMSIQSDFKSEDDLDTIDNNNGEENKSHGSTTSIENLEDASEGSELDKNKEKAQASNNVFNAICNVANSMFDTKPEEKTPCDNEIDTDAQGNIINNKENLKTQTSNDVIGANLNEAFDNLNFLENRNEALKNKQKVMAHEFGQIDNENNDMRNLPELKTSSIDNENNVEEEWTFAEARKNKLKVLGAEFFMSAPEVKTETIFEPITEAQKEALINKQKVLGVEYNLPSERISKKNPANVAQEEAIRNRNKVLGSEYDINVKSPKFDSSKKSALRLNLKPYGDSLVSTKTVTTPNTGAVTPGELFPGVSKVN